MEIPRREGPRRGILFATLSCWPAGHPLAIGTDRHSDFITCQLLQPTLGFRDDGKVGSLSLALPLPPPVPVANDRRPAAPAKVDPRFKIRFWYTV